ncbi:hypothetical protein F750_6609 [Streptomyces sp. PAMC 26508]|nr:hypothetical protein F750_6609 [Streptomyces sp. PAMC 26508]
MPAHDSPSACRAVATRGGARGSWTPADIAELCDLLGDPFEVVRGDTFFDLMDRAGRRT